MPRASTQLGTTATNWLLENVDDADGGRFDAEHLAARRGDRDRLREEVALVHHPDALAGTPADLHRVRSARPDQERCKPRDDPDRALEQGRCHRNLAERA